MKTRNPFIFIASINDKTFLEDQSKESLFIGLLFGVLFGMIFHLRDSERSCWYFNNLTCSHGIADRIRYTQKEKIQAEEGTKAKSAFYLTCHMR